MGRCPDGRWLGPADQSAGRRIVKRLVRLLLIVAIVVGGLGFYRGWFVLSSGRHSGSNKVDVNLSVDPDKVKADAEQASPLK